MITAAAELEISKDPFAVLAEKEQTATNHDEWMDVHDGGLLDLLITKEITREQYLQIKKDERKELEKQALVDYLTGIWNRAGLELEMQRQLGDAKRLERENHKLLGSVIFLDVDSFKKINDTYKHEVGDEILKTYATTIKESVRDLDTVGRFGGDEFVVFLRQATQEQAKEIADHTRQRIIEAVKQKFHDLGKTLDWEQTISAGASQLRSDDKISSILARADTALDYAKKSGKNKALIFDDKTMELKTK